MRKRCGYDNTVSVDRFYCIICDGRWGVLGWKLYVVCEPLYAIVKKCQDSLRPIFFASIEESMHRAAAQAKFEAKKYYCHDAVSRINVSDIVELFVVDRLFSSTDSQKLKMELSG
jgi:hypothetical protein